MRMALALAARARGWTSPNPLVGAVLVRRGQVVARAWHRRPGTAHAEALVLQAAGSKARGATLYVNLEPCCHTEKRTPPCVRDLIRAGIRRVVVAMVDPNPQVSGRGLAQLQKAGIAVTCGVLEEAARRLNEAYMKYITTGLPFVILKMATTLDGRIATASGESQWITGPVARRWVHRLRAAVDAVLVGSGTVLRDNPRLTAREVRGPVRQPLRVVVDSHLKIHEEAQVLDVREAPTLIVTTDRAPLDRVWAFRARGVEVWVQEGVGGRVDLGVLFQGLGRREISSVLVEGGSEVAGTLIREHGVDKVVWFVAPRILGGRGSIPAVGGPDPAHLSESLWLEAVRTRRVGADWLLEGYPRRASCSPES